MSLISSSLANTSIKVELLDKVESSNEKHNKTLELSTLTNSRCILVAAVLNALYLQLRISDSDFVKIVIAFNFMQSKLVINGARTDFVYKPYGFDNQVAYIMYNILDMVTKGAGKEVKLTSKEELQWTKAQAGMLSGQYDYSCRCIEQEC